MELPLIWPGVNDTPVVLANMFLSQVGSPSSGGRLDPPVLIIGQVTAPVLLGSPEEQQAMMRAVGGVEVKTLNRFSIPIGRLTDLRQVIDDLITNATQAQASIDQQIADREKGGES